MGKYFGTDGIRGIVGEELTEEFAERLGLAAGTVVGAGLDRQPAVVLARDTRASGAPLKESLVRGLCRAGVHAVRAGVLPTAAVALLASERQFDAGIVVSASHNAHDWNGIKFFDASGFKLSDEIEAAIEAAIDTVPADAAAPGDVTDDASLVELYRQHLLSACDCRLDSLRVVVDCAHGAASELAPSLLQALGADVICMNTEPNGENINAACGALHPEVIARSVLDRGADLGMAFDGDADRVIFSDERGRVVGGDEVLAMCAADRAAGGSLRGGIVVGTEASGLGLERALGRMGCSLVRARVGDRYVIEEMRRSGALLGGEPSGHTIFLDKATTGDGVLTAIIVASLMVRRSASLSTLAAVLKPVPQAHISVPIARRADANDSQRPCGVITTDPIVQEAMRQARSELGEEGRVVVRPSGTEPVVRVLVEGPDATLVERLARGLAETIAARTC